LLPRDDADGADERRQRLVPPCRVADATVNRDESPSARGGQSGDEAAEVASRYPRWLLVTVFVVAGTLLVAMLRFAIDLLAVVCVVWLLGWTGHRVADWLFGEDAPVWAAAQVFLTLVAAILVLEWVGAPAFLVPHIERHVPGAVTRAAAAAAARGWGQTLVWRDQPGKPPSALARADEPLPAAPVAPVAKAPPSDPVPAPPPRARPRLARPQLDLDADAEAAEPSSGLSRVPTAIWLQSSRPAIPAGLELRLIAHVTTESGEVPSGRVEFRRGRDVLGVAPVTPRGRASLSVRTLPIGTHEISAHFSGDARFAGSRAEEITQVVTR
jgi:hypothetical protein